MDSGAPRHPIDTRLAERMASGRPLRAVFNGIPSPAIVEMCAWAGFDALIIDNEHGSADWQTTEHMLRAARAAGIPALVRCVEADIARTLDMGAAGVQVPMVETAEQAARLVERVRYPLPGAAPGRSGSRGSAFSTRAAGYGAFGGDAHTALSNQHLVLVVMIESPLGVANAAAIAAVPGVDAIFVGPNDLSHGMGLGSRWREAPVQACIESTLRAAAAAGVCPGVLALDAEDEARYARWGARYFASVTTGLITQAFRQAVRGGSTAVRY